VGVAEGGVNETFGCSGTDVLDLFVNYTHKIPIWKLAKDNIKGPLLTCRIEANVVAND